jgi:hypothetical protein
MKTLSQLILCVTFVLLAGCGGQTLSKTNPNNVNLELDYQEVIHYDCNNNVVSDSIQVVSPPTAWVTINPSDSSNLGGSTFLNTATGSTAPLVQSYTTFIVDHGNGALTMHVNTGVNLVNYTFYSCDQWATDGSGTCAVAQTVKEQGTLTLNIVYTEKTLPGVQKVNDCVAPTPTPAPTPVQLN